MAIEAKKDLRVVIPYTALTLALFVLLGLGRITWQQCLGGLVFLNAPAFFGLRKDDDDEGPPAPPPDVPDDVPTVKELSPRPPLPRVNTPITSWSPYAIVASSLLLVTCLETMTPQQKAEAADTSYLAEMKACVAAAKTLEDSRACRADVRAHWDLDGGDHE